jgi:hypothetical protein
MPVKACASLHFMRWFAFLWVTLALGFALPTSAAAANLSGAQIRDLIIRQSIASYPGNCPCPCNLDRAGRRCQREDGGRVQKPGRLTPT